MIIIRRASVFCDDIEICFYHAFVENCYQSYSKFHKMSICAHGDGVH